MELIKKIKDKSPEYDANFEEMIGRFTVTQGGRAGTAKESELSDQNKYFFTKYEIYIYAFFLGIRNERRLPLPKNTKKVDFIQINSWQPSEIADYLIMGAITKSGIDLFELEGLEEKEILDEIKKIKTIIEEYANGGFMIIKEMFENHPEYFVNNDNCFIELLEKIHN